jgi:hypothetical protein
MVSEPLGGLASLTLAEIQGTYVQQSTCKRQCIRSAHR